MIGDLWCLYTKWMGRFKYSFIYIMTNKRNGTLYVGVTTNLLQRTYQHRNHLIEGFTDKYNLDKLVYYEIYDDLHLAIAREKQLKKWKRAWKIKLIEILNPSWKDLFDSLV